MKNKIIFIVGTILLFIIINSFLVATHKSGEITGIKIAGQKIRVDLALTPAEQAQGLSGRQSLKDDEGMLFVFPTTDIDQIHKFWMKDMNFSIDMIWIDKNMQVVYIEKNAKPESYPNVFGPDSDAPYVLEVVSGFADKNNLKVGDRVQIASPL